MKLYRHLAWDGIRKNSRLYVPYLLTGVGAVSFFYILVALSRLPEGTLPGSGSVQVILNLGSFVLWVFSLLLLFYTHSFLIRRRNREFALYNVLGMGKRDIARILCWETLLSGGISLAGGLALGILLSNLAVTIREPLAALTWFFAAVLMVVAATYLLFISGSVTLCRLLQKNPRFYYQKRHFVSVSSLVYRMKRNGAGLASICILGTMVLVMLSSSACLYFGAEDSLKATYPHEFALEVWLENSADMPKLQEALTKAGAAYGVNVWEKGTVEPGSGNTWSAAFDTGLSQEQQLALSRAIDEALGDTDITWNYFRSYRAEAADDFYGTYGSLFFIGIVLSVLFICAAVLIIYYKQLCEGYEDQPRFAIMQKVGMTAADIRRSVNSQLLTVFFLPLAGAALHMAFAFPMIRRMLLLFELHNTGLFIATALVSFAVLAVVYTLVYKATSNAYYRIVKGSV